MSQPKQTNYFKLDEKTFGKSKKWIYICILKRNEVFIQRQGDERYRLACIV